MGVITTSLNSKLESNMALGSALALFPKLFVMVKYHKQEIGVDKLCGVLQYQYIS